MKSFLEIAQKEASGRVSSSIATAPTSSIGPSSDQGKTPEQARANLKQDFATIRQNWLGKGRN
jgi:hypothetical protein